MKRHKTIDMYLHKIKVSLYYHIFKRDFGEKCRLYGIPRMTFKKNIHFGKDIHINDNVFLQGDGGIEIGDFVNFSYGVTVLTAKYDLEQWTNMNRKHAYETVTIGNHVFLGANVTIQPGITIGDHIFVAPGSVVTHNLTEPFCVYGGVPARKIKSLKYEVNR